MKEKENNNNSLKRCFCLVDWFCVRVCETVYFYCIFYSYLSFGYYNRISATTVTSGHDFVQERAS